METINQTICIDNVSVISDITDNNDNNTLLSLEIENKIIEIKTKLNSELTKFNIDNLKDKCKELNIVGISKLKKPELIEILEAEFLKLIPILKEKKASELKNICKNNGIKGITAVKKEYLIYQILLYNCSNMKFKIDELIIKNDIEKDDIKKEDTKKEDIKKNNLIEQLEKQKQEIEIKLREEEKKREDEKKIKDELEKKQKDEENKKKLEDEKKELKKKKQSIPKNVRVIIWNHYIGEDIIKHKCLCCKKVTISNTNFEVGHVISEMNGGTHEINNLRPICFACNHSMGTENMIDFVIKFGLYIG